MASRIEDIADEIERPTFIQRSYPDEGGMPYQAPSWKEIWETDLANYDNNLGYPLSAVSTPVNKGILELLELFSESRNREFKRQAQLELEQEMLEQLRADFRDREDSEVYGLAREDKPLKRKSGGRITQLFEELAENVGNQQQFQIDQQLEQQEAQRELYDTDEARPALKIAGILGLLAVPIPGSNTLAARLGLAQAGKPLINKSYGAVGGDMVSQTLKEIERRAIGQSGARVNTDVAGRVPLPKIKDPVVTKQGPRGPINIESPMGPPRPAPPKRTRNTGGISAAERAQLPSRGIPSTTTGRSTKSYMDNVRQTKLTEQQTNRLKFLEDELRIDQAKINAGEAPSKNFNKMLEEAARLRQLLKQ